MMTPASSFRIKPGDEEFTRKDFEESPAWSEHYDYFELDTIASWGVSRDLVAQQFRAMDTGGSHPNYTILDLDRLPHDHMRIFLKAEFRHSTGITVTGYIMNADAFCITLFLGAQAFTFSRHPELRSMMLPDKKEAEELIGVSELFPLSYRTAFYDQQGKLIIGEFSFQD